MSGKANRQGTIIGVNALGAWRDLAMALDQLAEVGQPVRCLDAPEDFYAHVGTDAAERAEAACWACPVQQLCRSFATANVERAGIWGGRHYGPGPRRTRIPTTTGRSQP